MMTKRLLFLTLAALVSAPILAGCATNNNPSTSTTSSSTTTTSSTTTSTVVTPPVGGTLELKLGTMMPLTGALNALGADMQAGAKLAVKEINDASATTGLHITEFDEDDKTSDAAAITGTFDKLVGQGVTAIAGPCCSGVTAAILDKAVQNQVVVSSPSATSPKLTLDRENSGFFWRVSPSDAVQGKVLAALVKDDGVASVSIIFVNNPYGSGLNKVFTDTFGAANIKGTAQAYNEQNTGDFSSQVTAVCGTGAAAIVIFGYIDDGANILKEMQKQGCLSKYANKIYGSEGLFNAVGAAGAKDLATKSGCSSGTPPCANGTWLAAGVKGTNPASGDVSAFNAKFKAANGHDPAQYSAESYDAVMYIALGALKANSVKGNDIQAHMLEVANSPGTTCNTWVTCATLIKAGTDINYHGAAHDFDYDARHEPKTGIYDVWQIQTDGSTKVVATGKSA